MSVMILNASDNVWSKETKVLSEEKSDRIIKAFVNGETTEFNFEDDPNSKTKVYDFKKNIFVIGLSLGSDSYSEELSNKTGTKTLSYSSYDAKFTIGRDFTFWHNEYTQPTRLYLTYSFTKLSSDTDFTTWTLGLQENMSYWSLYKTNTYSIYPTLSFELGSSSIARDNNSISGFTTELNLGIKYVRDNNFEYFLKVSTNSIDWKHPIYGVADNMSAYGINLGLNYKLMYGDF